MQHKVLYIVSLLALIFLVLVSLGEAFWGGSNNGIHWTSHLFYGICHQIPERTLSIGESLMAVNSRCFGVFTGLLVGWVLIPVISSFTGQKKWPVKLFYVALLIQIIDYTGNLLGFWTNTNLSRLGFGLFLGLSVPVAISDLFYINKN